MVGLMTAYTAKADGAMNPQYPQRVLNFMLALSASGDRKAFQYVSANLCSVSVRHISHITSKKRAAPLIDLDQEEMVLRIKDRINKSDITVLKLVSLDELHSLLDSMPLCFPSLSRFTTHAMGMQWLKVCTQTISCLFQVEMEMKLLGS